MRSSASVSALHGGVSITITGGHSHTGVLLWLWVAFLVTFGATRLSTRMIRARVRWWPGNVSAGGRHIHHIVLGIILVCASGVGAFSVADDSHVWRIVFAVVFGAGAALILDEFALVLNLDDVYWTTQGRTSVDAVVIAVGLTGLVLAGATPLGIGDTSNGTGWSLAVAVLINLGFVAVTLAKGKVWTGLAGILFPGLAIIGAMRVARPTSPWARWRYAPGSGRATKAQQREERRRRAITVKESLEDLIAGRPDTNESVEDQPEQSRGDDDHGGKALDHPERAEPG